MERERVRVLLTLDGRHEDIVRVYMERHGCGRVQAIRQIIYEYGLKGWIKDMPMIGEELVDG